jgi:hypothetical protein
LRKACSNAAAAEQLDRRIFIQIKVAYLRGDLKVGDVFCIRDMVFVVFIERAHVDPYSLGGEQAAR